MKTETIKDIITARWKFIASNAEQISAIARKMADAEMLDADALKEIRGFHNDNEATIKTLELLLEAIGTDEWDGDEE